MPNAQPPSPYVPPVLVRLGPVSMLTLGMDSGSRMELVMGSMGETSCVANRTIGMNDTECF